MSATNGRVGDGADAAAEVFERVLDSLEGSSAAAANGHLPKAGRVRLTQVRSAAARTLDLYGELFQRAFETYADLAQVALQPSTDPAPDTPLALAGPPGGEASTPLWIHNLTGAPVAGVALFATDLTSAGGDRIEGRAASLEPAALDVEPCTGAEVLLRVAIPATAAPGLYHGHVLSSALPASALSVRLEVEP